MEEAVKGVPESEHHCTPIAVKATAGLRLLGARDSEAILREVRRWLETEWPFTVVPGVEGVGVMEGRDEGVYAWITINYVRSPALSSFSSLNARIAARLGRTLLERVGCGHGPRRRLDADRLRTLLPR